MQSRILPGRLTTHFCIEHRLYGLQTFISTGHREWRRTTHCPHCWMNEEWLKWQNLCHCPNISGLNYTKHRIYKFSKLLNIKINVLFTINLCDQKLCSHFSSCSGLFSGWNPLILTWTPVMPDGVYFYLSKTIGKIVILINFQLEHRNDRITHMFSETGFAWKAHNERSIPSSLE